MVWPAISKFSPRELTNGICVLLTSFAPHSRESLDVLQAARQAGEDPRHYRLAGFPLAQAADCTLLFSIDSPSFFLPWSPAWGLAGSAGDAGGAPHLPGGGE